MQNVIVEYSGKRLPITFSMPWFSESGVTFGPDREAQMPQSDAERLCRENPGIFRITRVIAEQVVPDTALKPKKAASPKKKPAQKPHVKKE